MSGRWLAACCALAEARAHAEDVAAWGLPPGVPLPLGYRWAHVQQVVALALTMGARLGADMEALNAAAWLHDICKAQPQHARRGAEEAAAFLPTTDFPAARIPTVVAAIAQHEGLTRLPGAPPLQPLEAAVLWDADKLSKLGIDALALTLGSHFVRGQSLAQRRTFVDDFTRTVLAKTVQSMNTAPAQALARTRYAAMIAALDAWREEDTTP